MGGGRRFSVGGGAFEESRPEGEEERPKGTGFIMDRPFNELFVKKILMLQLNETHFIVI